MTIPLTPIPPFPTLWKTVLTVAESTGLDSSKFGEAHQALLQEIHTFLSAPTGKKQPQQNLSQNWFRRIGFRQRRRAATVTKTDPLPPIILVGEPGTGKTTFLYVIDLVLRQHVGLPDLVKATMLKGNGRSHAVPKRQYSRQPISLLSVRQWSDLLHFYAWDIEQHRFIPNAQQTFIHQTLRPMRILFADEVEMTGYAPTLPDLAREGLLIVGTSNQTSFPQLETRDMPPKIYDFSGLDMRSGDPDDAIVRRDDAAWALFAAAEQQPVQRREMLTYQVLQQETAVFVLVDFITAVSSAMLENDWLNLLNQICQEAQNSEASLVLLFDRFSLEKLRSDYNAIMRFVSLFDAIEQIGAGVFVRHPESPPTLSREALQHMKVTILTTRGVTEAVKQRVTVGIDRATSRIGQAGHHARQIIPE